MVKIYGCIKHLPSNTFYNHREDKWCQLETTDGDSIDMSLNDAYSIAQSLIKKGEEDFVIEIHCFDDDKDRGKKLTEINWEELKNI